MRRFILAFLMAAVLIIPGAIVGPGTSGVPVVGDAVDLVGPDDAAAALFYAYVPYFQYPYVVASAEAYPASSIQVCIMARPSGRSSSYHTGICSGLQWSTFVQAWGYTVPSPYCTRYRAIATLIQNGRQYQYLSGETGCIYRALA